MNGSKAAEANSTIEDFAKDMDEIVLQDEKQELDENRDLWSINYDIDDDQGNWREMSTKEKTKSVAVNIAKITMVVGLLYLFICSISLLGDAFQIIAGTSAGGIFANDSLLSNPITGLIIGVLVTVLVQSSSTSTSIVVTMVAANIIQVDQAVYIIMGTNIGTSVTNTLVSLSQSVEKEQFRRAFAGATVLDIFNVLTVLILLPLEVVSGYLVVMTKAIMDSFNIQGGSGSSDFLTVITDPLVHGIVQINDTVITLAAQGVDLESNASMIRIWCEQSTGVINVTEAYNKTVGHSPTAATGYSTAIFEMTTSYQQEITVGIRMCQSPSDFLFADTGMSDVSVGLVLLFVSLIILCLCLILMVKLLNSMMQGSVSVVIKKVINTNFKYPFGWVTGYLAILVGAGMTFLVQSSSVFTSTLTPLVGIGVISLKRMYPLTLGANIGTTATGILAALASDPNELEDSLQIALVHLFFNITGILIWYPISFMRLPIRGAKFLGNTTAEYRWFAVLYLICIFFLFPIILLALSVAHTWALLSVVICLLVIASFVTVVNLLQSHKPNWLPACMKTWEFLPLGMRSLHPYDKFFSTVLWCKCCCKTDLPSSPSDTESTTSHDTQPPAYPGVTDWNSGATNHAFYLNECPSSTTKL